MGLKECPGCGKKVSEKAETCVQCGYEVRNHFLKEERHVEFLKRKEREENLKAQRIKEQEERKAYIETLPPVKKFILSNPKRFVMICFALAAVIIAISSATIIHRNHMRSEFEIADGLYLNMTTYELKEVVSSSNNGVYWFTSDLWERYPEKRLYTSSAEHSVYTGLNHVDGIDVIFPFPYNKLKEIRIHVVRGEYKQCDLCPYYKDDFEHLLHDFDLEDYEFTQGRIDGFCKETYHTKVNGVNIIIIEGSVDDYTGSCNHHDGVYTVIYK